MNKILEENKKRNGELKCLYNPVTGEGSLVPRVPFYLRKDLKPILVPETMMAVIDIQKPLDQYNFKNLEEAVGWFDNLRFDHDYEYWTFKAITIKDKISAEAIPFKQNLAQRILTSELEDMRVNNDPIRAIITKARQWGGSTDTQFYMKWIQTRHKKNWHSAIVADVESQSKNVRAMYANAIRNYPPEIQSLSWRNFENQDSVKIIPERGCTVSIASMQKPDKLRSQDLKMSHLSEVGIWKKTEGKTPKDVIQSIQGTIPLEPYTVLVEESTAKGVGNYFHLSWLAAINGIDSNKRAIFIPWYKIEIYQKAFSSDEEILAFYKSLSDYEMYLWEDLGATLEGINWYREKLREFEGDTWRMNSEFPSTWQEAFQSTGQKAFSPKYITNIETTVSKPQFTGEIYGDDRNGELALENVHFIEEKGKLSVWRKPNDPPIPKGFIMPGRYVVTVDVGGRSETADYSAISVFDRYYMKDGGIPEAIITWHGKMDADLVAWKAAQIGKWFKINEEWPLLVIEVNFFDRKENSEGDAFYTTLDEIGPYYPNLFSRTTPEQIRNGVPRKYGFHMNRQTKPEIVRHYIKALRDGLYVEYDSRVVAEAHAYENQGDGRYNAVEGQHDDLLITRMLGVWGCYEYMGPVRLIELDKHSTKNRVDSAASFS